MKIHLKIGLRSILLLIGVVISILLGFYLPFSSIEAERIEWLPMFENPEITTVHPRLGVPDLLRPQYFLSEIDLENRELVVGEIIMYRPNPFTLERSFSEQYTISFDTTQEREGEELRAYAEEKQALFHEKARDGDITVDDLAAIEDVFPQAQSGIVTTLADIEIPEEPTAAELMRLTSPDESIIVTVQGTGSQNNQLFVNGNAISGATNVDMVVTDEDWNALYYTKYTLANDEGHAHAHTTGTISRYTFGGSSSVFTETSFVEDLSIQAGSEYIAYIGDYQTIGLLDLEGNIVAETTFEQQAITIPLVNEGVAQVAVETVGNESLVISHVDEFNQEQIYEFSVPALTSL